MEILALIGVKIDIDSDFLFMNIDGILKIKH
jgi:hypothetical protein